MGATLLVAFALGVLIIVNGYRTTVKRLRYLDYTVGGVVAGLAAYFAGYFYIF